MTSTASLLGTTLLTVVTVLSSAVNAQSPVDVLRYELDVTVQERELTVATTLAVKAAERPRKWSLALADRMKVLSAKSGEEDLPFEQSGGSVELDLSRVQASDSKELTIVVTARGQPRNRFSKARGGFLRTCVTPEITYIRSQYPWYPRARGDVATYRLTVDAREDWIVRTSGEHENPRTENGRTSWVFNQRTPVREIGLVAGPYKVVTANGAGTTVLDALVFDGHAKGAEVLLSVARRASQCYGELFGAVESQRFSLVEMPAAFGAGSGYGESGYVLIGEGAFTAAGEAPWASSLVAHEVSHTWWGREVMFSDFANESLACYSTLRFLEHDQGEDAARRERRDSARRVFASASSGKEISLKDIRGWGSGLDPATYSSHAYAKGMMLIAMVEQQVGRKAMDRTLVRLFREYRGKTLDYAGLRRALQRSGPGSRAVVAQWEMPGIPELEVEHEIKPAGKRFTVDGTLSQKGTARPFKMSVEVTAVCAGERIRSTVKLTGRTKTFRMTTPSKPEAILVDPEYKVLAHRPLPGPADPMQAITKAFKVVNNPTETDPSVLKETIAALAELKDHPGGNEALCYTGIGRCNFRLGSFDEAIPAFEKALKLGAGGPFHRAWIYLRLGNIADLRKDRSEACKHYRKSVAQGTKYWQARRAQVFLDRPYRGIEVDK